MGLLVSLFGERRSIENPSVPLAADDGLWGRSAGKSSSGIQVSTQTALSYSAFWRGVNLIARDVGKLACYIDKRANKGWSNDSQHPGYYLLRHKPNEYTSSIVFRQTLQGHALTEGNGYAFISRNGAGEPVELLILDPWRTNPIRYNGTLWYLYEMESGERRKLPYTDVIHIRGLGYDGLVGYSVIAKARENIGLALARETYASTFFKNNARPNVVLEHPGRMQAKAAENLRTSWERIHAGIENSHRTAILEEGMKAHELSINASDSQLIEQEKFGLIHNANWLNIPPHKVGGEGRTAYASLEMENQAYLDDGLDPWLVTHEEEYRDKLLTEDEKRSDSHRVRFDRNQLLRADSGARASYYTQMVNLGVLSLDEVRTLEGENPQANGTGAVYYRPLNMGVIGEDGVVRSITPPPPEPPPGEPLPVSDDVAPLDDMRSKRTESRADDDAELIQLPDIRQPDGYSCGAAVAMAVGQYFGVGPETIAEWKDALDTVGDKSTKPQSIVDYLTSLGLAVDAAHGMTVDDLVVSVADGTPVICCVYPGHYVAVVGASPDSVTVQDPAATGDSATRKIDAATWVENWHDTDIDGNEYDQFGILVSGVDVERAKRDAVRVAMEPVLADAVRRMVKRISTQAERAAADGKKFAAWLDTLGAENIQTVRDAVAPAETAIGVSGIAEWLAGELHSRFLDASGECTAKALPGKVAEVGAALLVGMPGEVTRKFVRCGGPGSGVPGPCPEGGEEGGGDKGDSEGSKESGKDGDSESDDRSPEEKERDEIDTSRESEDEGISEARDKEDQSISDTREAEDTQIQKDREKEDAEFDAREKEIDSRDPLSMQDSRDKEDAAIQKDRDSSDEKTVADRKTEDKDRGEKQTKEVEGYKADRAGEREKIDQSDEDALDAHDEKTDEGLSKIEEKHDKENESVSDQRDKEDTKTEKDREKEDSTREKSRDKDDAKQEKDADKLSKDRDKASDRRDKEDEKLTDTRDKEDVALQKQRDKADADIEKQRAKEDKEFQKKYAKSKAA